MSHKKGTREEASMEPTPMLYLWLDSVRHSSGWSPQADFASDATREGMLHHTLGYLIYEDDDSVMVAQSISAHPAPYYSVVDCIQIPKLAILDQKPVTIPSVSERPTEPRSAAAPRRRR